jgi:hypothetical protein
MGHVSGAAAAMANLERLQAIWAGALGREN